MKIEFNPADQADVTLLHKMLAALLPQPAPIVEVVHTSVAESQKEALAELQAEAQAAGEYNTERPVDNTGDYLPKPSQEAPKRRGRPPKNAEAATVATSDPPPAGQPVAASAAPISTVAAEASPNAEPPASGQGQAQSGSPVPAGSAPVLPTTVLEMIYNRDGAAVALSCLQRFGVTRIRELTPEQVPAFVGYCQGVVAGIENPLEGKA